MMKGLDAALAMMPSWRRKPPQPEHQPLPLPSQHADATTDDQRPDDTWSDPLRAAGLSLLFGTGGRPNAADIVRLVEDARVTGLLARVSHVAPEAEGWLELLASGLTFDLRGLAPAASAPLMPVHQSYGYGDGGEPVRGAIELVPSGHIVAGAALMPILRIMLGLASTLVMQLPGVLGVAWHPAGTVMEPRYFSRLVMAWLAGGAFPALGLTALHTAADGSVASRGLAHFTGQEMQLEGRPGEAAADTVKLAIRVVDHLVRHGRIAEAQRIGSGADALLAEPSQVGKLVLIWRDA